MKSHPENIRLFCAVESGYFGAINESEHVFSPNTAAPSRGSSLSFFFYHNFILERLVYSVNVIRPQFDTNSKRESARLIQMAPVVEVHFACCDADECQQLVAAGGMKSRSDPDGRPSSLSSRYWSGQDALRTDTTTNEL